ncbi:hypothetical protein GCM10017562_20450 [Streptomyces roseofulvus]
MDRLRRLREGQEHAGGLPVPAGALPAGERERPPEDAARSGDDDRPVLADPHPIPPSRLS